MFELQNQEWMSMFGRMYIAHRERPSMTFIDEGDGTYFMDVISMDFPIVQENVED